MRRWPTILLFLLAAWSGVAAQGPGGLQASIARAESRQQDGGFCRAIGHLKIVASTGTCTGTVETDCKAITESRNAIVEAFDEWFGEAGPGLCATGQANATATAHSKALADVWVKALVNVKCGGQGFACGYTLSNAEAWATSFAKAVAQAAAEAGGENFDTEGFCFADITALSTVFAKAAAKAKGDTCSYGGDQDPVEFMQENFATAINIGIAEAYAKAAARTCDSSADGRLKAQSKCEGRATTEPVGSVVETDDQNTEGMVGDGEGCHFSGRSTANSTDCAEDPPLDPAGSEEPPAPPPTDPCAVSSRSGVLPAECSGSPSPSPQPTPEPVPPSPFDPCVLSQRTRDGQTSDDCARSPSPPAPPPSPSPLPSPSPSPPHPSPSPAPVPVDSPPSNPPQGNVCDEQIGRRCCIAFSVSFCAPCQGCPRLKRVMAEDPARGIKRTWMADDGFMCYCDNT